LLSAGADPTNTIDEFAKKKKQFPTNKVSMGEEQEKPAEHAIVNGGFRDGKWLVLNNCHLSIEFMAKMEEVLNPKNVVVHEDFRLWITCQESKEFPLGLLQMAIKVTTEPPQGLQAGVARTFSTTINQDFLEKVEPYEKWRALVFTLCFMHSIVWERRKFGPLGFCIGYEFNTSDLEASLLYVEKHMTQSMATGSAMSMKAMKYMTCEIQYGGRITDDLDRETFITYGELWITDEVFKEKYCFNNLITEYLYHIPDFNEHSRYLEHIQTLPEKDNPLIFGLNGNADLTYRLKQSGEMIVVLVDTMPKDTSGGSGKSLEEEVKEKLQNELIKLLPPDFIEVEVDEKLKNLKGPKSLSDTGKAVPLNVFLFQEIQRLQLVLGIVRSTM
jgi:dynein heavy chain